MPFLSRNTDDAVSLGDSSLANSLALCPEGQPGICFDMQCFSLTQQCFLTKNIRDHTTVALAQQGMCQSRRLQRKAMLRYVKL